MELPNRPTKDPYQELPVKDFSYINTQKQPSKKTNHHWSLIISGLVLLLALGAGAFAYGQHTKNVRAEKDKEASHKQLSVQKATTPSITLTNYSSTNFNLTVNYPTSWLITTNGTTSMSITSPITSLTSDTGNTVNGRTVVTVLNQGQLPPGFGTSSVAVLNSVDVSFTNPTSDQAAQAYLSFVQYPATTVAGGLDAIYVTGNDGYVKDQNIPSSDVNQVSPLIIVSFERCLSSDCSDQSSLTVSSNMWTNSAFSIPILDIIKSFVFS